MHLLLIQLLICEKYQASFKSLECIDTIPLVFQALCKEDIVALKTRLQKIKKHGEEIISASSLTSSSTVSCAPNNVVPALPADAKDPSLTLARAKELAAKAQTRKEECEADESRQRGVPANGGYGPRCIYICACVTDNTIFHLNLSK